MDVVETWTDSTDQFDVVEERLVYVDGPLEGASSSQAGELFAFRCESIVADALWHWGVVPAESLDTSVSDAFRATRNSPAPWLSIVEDRRGVRPRMMPAWMPPEHPMPGNR